MDIPFYMAPGKVAAILRMTNKEVNTLIKAGELECFKDCHGVKVEIQSLILFLGKREFRKRWPGGLGNVEVE